MVLAVCKLDIKTYITEQIFTVNSISHTLKNKEKYIIMEQELKFRTLNF